MNSPPSVKGTTMTKRWPPTCLMMVIGLMAPAATAQEQELDAKTVKSGEEVPGWGTVIDPDGDCRIRVSKSSLEIQVPGTHHDFGGGKMNAPRVLTEVSGNFRVRVCVDKATDPDGPSSRADTIPYHGAGLLIWSDDTHYLRFEQAMVLREFAHDPYILHETHDGPSGVNRDGPGSRGKLWLRLMRHDKTVDAELSDDGKKWRLFKRIEVDWPEKLKVGVTAVSSASSPLSVTFDGFQVEKPPR